MFIQLTWADPEGGTGGPDPPEKHKNIGFLSNAGPDLLKQHNASKPAFNVGPSSVRQRNAISMAFRWRADDDPFIGMFGSSIFTSTKKSYQMWTPSDKAFWIRAWSKRIKSIMTVSKLCCHCSLYNLPLGLTGHQLSQYTVYSYYCLW